MGTQFIFWWPLVCIWLGRELWKQMCDMHVCGWICVIRMSVCMWCGWICVVCMLCVDMWKWCIHTCWWMYTCLATCHLQLCVCTHVLCDMCVCGVCVLRAFCHDTWSHVYTHGHSVQSICSKLESDNLKRQPKMVERNRRLNECTMEPLQHQSVLRTWRRWYTTL